MWIHSILFLFFCGLFLFAKGLFSKSGNYLAGKLPSFLKLTSKQIRLILLCAFWGNALGMAVTVWVTMIDDSNLIKRKDISFTEEWYVSGGDHKERIEVEVKREPYTNAEKIALLEEAVQSLESNILGENQSLQHVEYPLNLITEISSSGILIEWDTSEPMILDWDGQIGEDVPENGTSVRIQAELVLDEYRRTYEKEIMVFPQKLSESEMFVAQVEDEIEEKNKQRGAYLHLPQVINGMKLSWKKANHFHGVLLTCFVVLIGTLLVFGENSRKKEVQQKRLKEMQNDYPGILSKMLLFMQAGVSSRRALQKIATDYKWDLERGRPRRAAYEEILQVQREMEQGISEELAYRNLGSRSELLCFRTFSTLLIQNLKKGSSYFLSALKQECTNAFEERKSSALIEGEKVGTKLLIPMGGMLLIVLLIILVPSMMVLG